jgi:hypothetical protein
VCVCVKFRQADLIITYSKVIKIANSVFINVYQALSINQAQSISDRIIIHSTVHIKRRKLLVDKKNTMNSQPFVLQIKDKMKTCSVIGRSFHTRCETNHQRIDCVRLDQHIQSPCLLSITLIIFPVKAFTMRTTLPHLTAIVVSSGFNEMVWITAAIRTMLFSPLTVFRITILHSRELVPSRTQRECTRLTFTRSNPKGSARRRKT